MKNIISLKGLFVLFAFFATTACFAQSDDLVLADQYYSKFSFGKAIPLYEKVLSHNRNDLKTKVKLADCYRRNNRYQEAEKWYAEIVADSNSNSQQQLLYAQVLLNLNKRDKATEQMKQYISRNPSDLTTLDQLNAMETNADFFKDNNLFEVKRLLINTPSPDMCATPYKDGIVFSSSREGGKSKEQDWTSRPYLALWYSEGKEMRFSTPKVLELGEESKFNDGPVCFNADYTKMYITRNYEENGKAVKDKGRVVRLKILEATYKEGKFNDFKDFKYNGKEYSCAHPFLSADGSKLYFASDMPGTVGGMDLWMCNKIGEEWDKPVNLGSEVNTKGNEVFPFVDIEGKLFFSSSGRVGVGGLDIYSATSKDGKFADIKNIGVPLNSTFDDFAYVYDKKNRCGYLSSNRDTKNENDDMYMFKLKCVKLDGLVFDKDTKEPIANAKVKINEGTNFMQEVTTDERGAFVACLNIGSDYDFTASKEAYKDNTVSLKDINDEPQKIKIPLELTPMFALKGHVYLEEDKSSLVGQTVKLANLKTNEVKETLTDKDGNYYFPLEANTDYRVSSSRERCAENSFIKTTVGLKKSTTLIADIGFFCEGDVIKIDNIYYDLAKWNIRPDAAKELDKLVTIMKKYPKMTIELGSHTDCRASEKYNQDLSQKRAKSAVDYIAKNGVDVKRMTAKGYGESVLVNKCECEGTRSVPCTEAEHQANRRTEFKVLTVK